MKEQMVRPYSVDLRRRVLAYIQETPNNISKASRGWMETGISS
jgi:hypothetical protein